MVCYLSDHGKGPYPVYFDFDKSYRLFAVQNMSFLLLQFPIFLYVGKLLTINLEIFRFFPFRTHSKMQVVETDNIVGLQGEES